MLRSPISLFTRLRLALVVLGLILCVRYGHGQAPAPALQSSVSPPGVGLQVMEPTAGANTGTANASYQPIGDGATVKVNFPTVPIQAIIPIYEDLTGRKLILDANLQGNQLRIVSKQLLTKKEAIAFIEANLLGVPP